MAERPFHHGNLRAVLLDEATVVLRESGVDGLSLRDLARRAGVSHGAPRSHFVDRQALLDALAEVGFRRLTADVRAALDGPGDVRARFLRVAGVYVDFAIDDAALMDLMFQAKAQTGGWPPEVSAAAVELFTVLDAAMGPRSADTDADARDAFKMLFAATVQGIASLVSSHRVSRADGDRLVTEAMVMMLDSALAARTVSAG